MDVDQVSSQLQTLAVILSIAATIVTASILVLRTVKGESILA